MSSKLIVKLLKGNKSIFKRSYALSKYKNDWESVNAYNDDMADEHKEPTPCK
jgi:hypothetical protein